MFNRSRMMLASAAGILSGLTSNILASPLFDFSGPEEVRPKRKTGKRRHGAKLKPNRLHISKRARRRHRRAR